MVLTSKRSTTTNIRRGEWGHEWNQTSEHDGLLLNTRTLPLPIPGALRHHLQPQP